MVIESPPERGEKKKRRSLVKLGIKLEIIPTPPRSVPPVPAFHSQGSRLSVTLSLAPLGCWHLFSIT